MTKIKPEEIYVSVDIEADGPIPGPHSMLSIGAVAYGPHGSPLGEFTVNLETLPEATPHPTMTEWWQQFPDAWNAHRRNTQPPAEAMNAFADWLEGLPGKPIFLAWPATWDFMWIYWYLIRFTGRRPFSEHGIDVRSYAMGMRRQTFGRSSKNYLPKRWSSPNPHTHVAVDDAREQGDLFIAMLRENLGIRNE
ncbi:exonuclease domain-containing protein [Methylococcus mesophilus]|uniref:exonuclease domain-containing protein n=1 Tax=Methylococcus mesophilus TaxID=2993564 RepID=UPI00224A74FA|nr:exonuclease domain-containing protein [Methylococcus mesophilus]UZR30235.1 exonuclease domain-containing protein [Methylococcus mesophilus]